MREGRADCNAIQSLPSRNQLDNHLLGILHLFISKVIFLAK